MLLTRDYNHLQEILNETRANAISYIISGETCQERLIGEAMNNMIYRRINEYPRMVDDAREIVDTALIQYED